MTNNYDSATMKGIYSRTMHAAIAMFSVWTLGCVDELPIAPLTAADSIRVSVFFDDDFEIMVGSTTLIAALVTLGNDTLTGLHRARFKSLDPTILAIRSFADLPENIRDSILGSTTNDSLDATIAAEVSALRRGFGEFAVTLDSIQGTDLIEAEDYLFVTERWQSVSAGVGHTCAVTFANTFTRPDTLELQLGRGGQAFCWGRGNLGALGTGSSSQAGSPTRVRSDIPFNDINAGGGFTCSTDLNGLLHCWGDNTHGALGLGNRLDQFVPRLTALGETFNSFDAGSGLGTANTTCAVKENGDTLCWGSNITGQLGCGAVSPNCPSSDSAVFWVTQPNTAESIKVVDANSTPLPLRRVSVGDLHACGITSLDGTAYCWGENAEGELGVSTTATTCVGLPCSRAAAPVEDAPGVPTVHRFETISAGGHFTCGVTTINEVWCWGANTVGQLGNGTVVNSPIPTRVEGTDDLSFVSVDAGFLHACALTDQGGVYCWGDNSEGQLGDGSLVSSTTAVPVTTDESFVILTVGDVHTCAIADVAFDLRSPTGPPITRPSGSIWCWGGNDAGQLGDDTFMQSSFPVRIAEPFDFFE